MSLYKACGLCGDLEHKYVMPDGTICPDCEDFLDKMQTLPPKTIAMGLKQSRQHRNVLDYFFSMAHKKTVLYFQKALSKMYKANND
jgi:hypothetical protein